MTYFPAILLIISIAAVAIEVWAALSMHRQHDEAQKYDDWKKDRSFNMTAFLIAGLTAPVLSSLALGYLMHEGGFSPLVLVVCTLTLASALGTVCMGCRLAVISVWIMRDNVHNLDRVKSVTPA
jgi:hypothetical protein